MTAKDPARWLESGEAPEPLRRLLETGRAELGAASEVEALAQSLSQTLGSSTGLPVPPAAGPRPLQRLGRAHWLAAAGALTSAIALWWVLGRSPPGTQPPPNPAALHVTQPSPSLPVPAPDVSRSSASNLDEDADAPQLANPPGSSGAPRQPRSRVHAPATSSEAKLLEQARGALRDRPAWALALTHEHRRRFPHGALTEEREVIAIEALERLGQHRAASDQAGAFGTRFRDSVHQPHLEHTPSAPGGAPTH